MDQNLDKDPRTKANKRYSTYDNSSWHCFWHRLSGDELRSQIISIFYKQKKENSWAYDEVSAPYKHNEEDGLKVWLSENYPDASDEELNECMNYILEFLDDARIEYVGKPFRR
jgi:hypothetical protein